MKKVLLLVLTGIMFYSCNTNPPTSPESISYPAGKIISNVQINLEPHQTTAQKIVLLEDFANVGCVPCVTSNIIIESLLHGTYAHKIAVVKFPIYWPTANDPFYLANESLCFNRIGYYNVQVAPTIMVDGLLSQTNGTDSVGLKEKIDQRLSVTAPFSINVNRTYQDSSLITDINVQAINLAGISKDDLVLYTVVVENNVEYDAPNGETEFHHVLRRMLPVDEGLSFASLPDTTLNWQIDLLSSWNPENLHVVAFIQNVQTKEVLQAGADY